MKNLKMTPNEEEQPVIEGMHDLNLSGDGLPCYRPLVPKVVWSLDTILLIIIKIN